MDLPLQVKAKTKSSILTEQCFSNTATLGEDADFILRVAEIKHNGFVLNSGNTLHIEVGLDRDIEFENFKFVQATSLHKCNLMVSGFWRNEGKIIAIIHNMNNHNSVKIKSNFEIGYFIA